jgi:hypothetical protein
MADVFISYSREDQEFVRRLHRNLKRLKRDTWIDWSSIPPTAKWWREILHGIEAADNFIFVISPTSLASATCQKELAHAAQNSKRLVPVLLKAVPHQDFPRTLAEIQWISFKQKKSFDPALKDLVKAIRTDLDALAMSAWDPSSLPDWLNAETFTEKIRPLLANVHHVGYFNRPGRFLGLCLPHPGWPPSGVVWVDQAVANRCCQGFWAGQVA